jgi:hypothetical protein
MGGKRHAVQCSHFIRPSRRCAAAIALGSLVLAVAGCGGAVKVTTQSLSASGYRFLAPASWTVTSAASSRAASSGAVDRVEVFTFALEHPYRFALFTKASRELDRVIAKLALQLRAHIAERSTVQVGGRAARSYRLLYDADRTQEIVFVLRGDTEYELVCERLLSDSDAPCVQLLQSFALTAQARA